MTTNPPVTVTYSLEEILTRFEQNMNRQFTEVNQKIDKQSAEVNQKIDKQSAEVNQRLTQLEIGQATLSGEIKTLEEKINGLDNKIDGISKRIDNQEIISRGVVIGLLVAVIGGLAKIFGWMPTN
jgi:predicted RNase H-like nuclease (RuvC/YqgF family)